MSWSISRLCAVATVFAATSATIPAGADLPPPPGITRIGYSFSVANLEAFPSCVVLAYPYSMSNGAPTREVAVVGKKPVGVGRRGGSPQFWALSKEAYDKAKLSLEGYQVAETTLQAIPGVRKAAVVVHPMGTVSSDSGITGVQDVFEIVKCDDKALELRAKQVRYSMQGGGDVVLPYGADGARPSAPDKSPKPANSGATPPSSSGSAAPSASAEKAGQPAAVPPTRGCGSCTTASGSGRWESLIALGALLGAALIASRRWRAS